MVLCSLEVWYGKVKIRNGILFILNAVGKSEKSFPNEKEKYLIWAVEKVKEKSIILCSIDAGTKSPRTQNIPGTKYPRT